VARSGRPIITPCPKRGNDASGDTDPEMPLQTGGAGQITERFPSLKAKDVQVGLDNKTKACILYVWFFKTLWRCDKP